MLYKESVKYKTKTVKNMLRILITKFDNWHLKIF